MVGPSYGCGSYGKVLRGIDTHTGGAVAIKAVADGRMRPGALEREVAIMNSFSAGAGDGEGGEAGGAAHPNIVQLRAFLPMGSSQVCTDQGAPLPGPCSRVLHASPRAPRLQPCAPRQNHSPTFPVHLVRRAAARVAAAVPPARDGGMRGR